jgi:hypothetical protein
MDNKSFEDTQNMFKLMGDRIESVLKMMPDTPLQRVELNGMNANACILKDGRVLIEFSTPEEAQKYVAELGIDKKR